MQTVSLKMKAGDLKKVIDLPNFRDDQRVKVTVSNDVEETNLTKEEIIGIVNELAGSLSNSPDKNKSLDEIRMERLAEKIIAARAKKNLEVMEEIQSIIGDDKGWESEEEMIKDLAEMRRHRIANENYA